MNHEVGIDVLVKGRDSGVACVLGINFIVISGWGRKSEVGIYEDENYATTM